MVLADSHGIPRVPCYSGYSKFKRIFSFFLPVDSTLSPKVERILVEEEEDYWTFTIYGAGFSCFVFLSLFLQSQNSRVKTSGFPQPHFPMKNGLGLSHFARRYSGNRFCFLFLRLLRCFSSPGCLFLFYEFKKEF